MARISLESGYVMRLPVERQNAMDLLNKAYQENQGKMPADWRLPAELTNLKFKHIRKQLPDGIEFSYSIDVNVPEADLITQIQLISFSQS